MHKKIEIDILFFILIEAMFLLFFFKESILTMILGIILGEILIYFSKKIKKNNITQFILFIITIPLSLITIHKTIYFINYNILKNYPIYVIIIPFLIISLYLVVKNYHTFIKSVEISFYLFIIIKIISFILIIPKLNFNNIVISHNIQITYRFILIGFSILYLDTAINYLTNYEINKKRSIISFINPLLIKILVIMSLGNTLSLIYKYPYVDYLKTIKYFDFIERIDGILSFEYLISFYYTFIFFLFIVKKPLKRFNQLQWNSKKLKN